MKTKPSIAYICMEFGIDDSIISYSGGLGILAGDTIKSASDMGLDFVGISLLYKNGYFKQIIDENGNQISIEDSWDYAHQLTLIHSNLETTIGSIPTKFNVWQKQIKGIMSHSTLLFLDFDIEGNTPEIRAISNRLYPEDKHINLLQHLAIGYASLDVYKVVKGELPQIVHINESHSAFCTIRMLKEMSAEEVKNRLVFTTHTPVDAGHVRYTIHEIQSIIGDDIALIDTSLRVGNQINLSELALFYAKIANAVSKKHREISQTMFPNNKIEYITNGVHHLTWASTGTSALFDRYISDWRLSPSHLRQALIIPEEEILETHNQNKKALKDFIQKETGVELDTSVFTIGFARRSAFYKRNDMIFSNVERLNRIAQSVGGMQFVFAGKAHPQDRDGQNYIKNIYAISKQCNNLIRVLYIPNYSISLSQLLVSGVDLWLNNPIVPLEASGTSGMKASLNGIPNLSTFDGWWREGAYEDRTGWTIGGGCEGELCYPIELEEMYSKLESKILPLYYNDKQKWASIMKQCIALNASYFNSQRMLEEYIIRAYLK